MLVFSSALTTNSLDRKEWPSQIPAYRSRTRPAFASKSGSRGKIHVRWRQGRMASSVSHRHKVVSPIDATNPCRTTSRFNSGMVKRDSGRPRSWGSSQASALTATTTLGGKLGWASPPWPFLQPWQSFFEEPLPPLGHDLPRRVQPGRDLIVVEAISRVEDDSGPDNLPVRRRIFARDKLKPPPLFVSEKDDEWALSWHTHHPAAIAGVGRLSRAPYVIIFRKSST